MTNQIPQFNENKLRREFYLLFGDGSGAGAPGIADWWLEKIAEAEEQGMEKMQIVVQNYFRDVLNLPCPDFTFNIKN